ncbi:hypothetical protein FRC17_011179 [Serendipita sp. 399]|nr:hypothetical protein FRC17_011179 [Serendipita sp. 399]
MITLDDKSKTNPNFKSSERWTRETLSVELETIKKTVSNECVAGLFAQVVLVFFEKRSRWWNSDVNLEGVVLDVKDALLAVDASDQRFWQCQDILLKGLGDLKVLMPRNKSERKLAALVKAEVKAVNEDKRRYERVQKHPVSPSSNTQVDYFVMKDPDKEPDEEPCHLYDLTTDYNQLIWQLRKCGAVDAPELWIMREDRRVQFYTTSGRHWVFVDDGEKKIEETILYVVDVSKLVDCYIVALVDDGESEHPCPIGVPIYGKNECCDQSCGSLLAHLESTWGVAIKHARLFRKPPGRCVLDTTLHSLHFPPRRNELYLRVSKQMEDSNIATAGTSGQ